MRSIKEILIPKRKDDSQGAIQATKEYIETKSTAQRSKILKLKCSLNIRIFFVSVLVLYSVSSKH